MVSLSVEISSVTETISTTDAKGSALVAGYANAIGASGSNRERLQAVLISLVRHMETIAARYDEEVAAIEARTSARKNTKSWG